ncbi:MAG: D-aminoacyl-tRNA deacylase [Puniceicoccales bacterium]
MRAVIQRVDAASVSVEGEVVGEIGHGLLIFLGVGEGDTADDVAWLAAKVCKLRVFEDDEGKMNRAVTETDGGVLVISQFTLFGNLKKGTRPSFNRSAPPEVAIPLYEAFIAETSRLLGKPVPSGRFAADMTIHAVNDGPVTLVLDTRQKDF